MKIPENLGGIIKTEYKKWARKALAKGWHIPVNFNNFRARSWIAYWQACEDYERNPESGRPVVPHRSGGGDDHV